MPRNPATKPNKPKAKPAEEQPSETTDVQLPAPEPEPVKEEPPAPPVQVIERRIETKTVAIPLGEPPHRIRQIHIEALLWGDHAHTFGRLRQALRDKDARTANGRPVKSGPDALRWLLEQFADG